MEVPWVNAYLARKLGLLTDNGSIPVDYYDAVSYRDNFVSILPESVVRLNVGREDPLSVAHSLKEHLLNLYSQFGRGGITVFRGSPIPHVQYGRGFDSLFKNMGRIKTPLFGKAVRYAGKTGLENGIGLLSDVLSGENVKTIAKRRASAAFQQAKQDALEEVKSTVKRRRKGSSTTTTPGKKIKKRKGGQKGGRYRRRRRRTTADIFG